MFEKETEIDQQTFMRKLKQSRRKRERTQKQKIRKARKEKQFLQNLEEPIQETSE